VNAPAPRRAGARDLDALVELWLALCLHHAELSPVFRLGARAKPELRELLRDQLDDPSQLSFVLDAPGGGLAGFCTVRVERAPAILAEPQRAEILDLFVRPEYRKAGIATQLVGAACDWVRARGVRRVEVRVLAANGIGQRFWRDSGFTAFVDVLERSL
jgi:GNAT superfamily N-acetyltransferase